MGRRWLNQPAAREGPKNGPQTAESAGCAFLPRGGTTEPRGVFPGRGGPDVVVERVDVMMNVMVNVMVNVMAMRAARSGRVGRVSA